MNTFAGVRRQLDIPVPVTEPEEGCNLLSQMFEKGFFLQIRKLSNKKTIPQAVLGAYEVKVNISHCQAW